jgi:ComEC/Rec2-related protein
MALGYHDVLSPTVEGAFQSLGLTHLLVVSGYQVSLVFGCIVTLASRIGSRLSLGRYARVLITGSGFLCAALYVLLIGAEMSAVRALIAAGCVCAHILTETGARFAQRWGIALFVMQMVWPWCILEIGVILTFAALLGIGLGVQLGEGHSVRTYLLVTVAAWVCTSLVVVCWSGSFSAMSLILNFVLAAPWSMLNCTAGILGLVLLLGNVPGGEVILHVVSWINFHLAEWLIGMRDLPFASFSLSGGLRIGASLALGSILCVLLVRSCLTWNRTGRSS